MGTQNIARHVHFGHTSLQARVLEWGAIAFSKNKWFMRKEDVFKFVK